MLRQECKAFQKVLADTPNNKGKDSKEWKTPQGYKGASDKDRTKLRKDHADKRKKDKNNSLGIDTESEDEPDSDGEDGDDDEVRHQGKGKGQGLLTRDSARSGEQRA